MRAPKYVVILLIVALVGIVVAGQGQPVSSAQAGRRGASASQPGTDAEAVNLGGHKSELTRRMQVVEMDLAGIDARLKALREQMAIAYDKGAAADKQLEEFSNESRRLVMDKAAKEAQRQVLRSQLEEVQKRFTQVAPSAPPTDAEVVNLGGQKSELTRRAQVVELDLAGIDARQKALQEQIALIRGRANKGSAEGGQLGEFARELSRLTIDKAGQEAQQQTIRRQLEEVQKQLTQVAPSAPRTDAEAVNLGGQKNELTGRAQVVEMELAGIDARQGALRERIATLRGEASKGSSGGKQLAELTRELSRLTIDKAGKEAQQRTIRRQLEEVQRQLAQASVSSR